VCVCVYVCTSTQLWLFRNPPPCPFEVPPAQHSATLALPEASPRKSAVGVSEFQQGVPTCAEDNRPLCQLSSKRLEDSSAAIGERLPESRCFAEDKRLLCQLSSKRLEDNWQSGLVSSATCTRIGMSEPWFRCNKTQRLSLQDQQVTHTHREREREREQHPRHRHTHAHDKNNTPNPKRTPFTNT